MIDTNSLKASLIDLAVSGRLSAEFQAEDSVSEIIEKLPKPSNKRKKLLGQAFEYGKQSAIPENWRWMLLGEISSYGDTPVKASISNVSDNTWILDLEDIKAGGELLTKTRAKEKQFVGEKTIFHSGQVLYSKLRPYLKKVLVADENGISTPELISFDVFGGILPQYIVCCLLDSFTNRAIDKRSYGIKMPRIDAGFMVNLPVPVPPVSEQHYIIERLEAAFSLIDTIENLQIKYTSNQETLKSKLIAAAIQGKLTEQLPEDGTAEELYQKIQHEKESLIKAKKLKRTKGLPAIEEDEIPFEIPNNWKWVRIGEVFTLQAGKNITASAIKDEADDSYRYLCYGGNGVRGYVTKNNVSGRHVLIGRQGALCGNINMADGDFYATEHAVVVYQYANTEPDWAGNVLKALNLNQYATSVAQPGLAVGKIEKVLMPLPPVAEQKRIARKIEEALAAIGITN